MGMLIFLRITEDSIGFAETAYQTHGGGLKMSYGKRAGESREGLESAITMRLSSTASEDKAWKSSSAQ